MNGEFGVALAFVTGATGAVHCLGMCCGINGGYFAGCRRPPRIRDLVTFHSVRIAVYTVLGVVGALLGRAVAVSGIVGKGQGLSMMLGGVLVVLLGLNLGGWIGRRTGPGARAATVPFCDALPAGRRDLPPLIAGLFNGLVPCSLVFIVAIQAAATADPVRAAQLMLAFGLGTLPAMVALSALGAAIGDAARGAWARLSGMAAVMLGLWSLYEGYVMYDVFRGLANW